MTNNKPEHKGKPKWSIIKRSFNFGEGHNKMLTELVEERKKTDHRVNMSVIVEDAIALLYSQTFEGGK